MASEKHDKSTEQDPFLTMIDAKMAALHGLRASYIAAVSVGAFGHAGDPSAAAPVLGTTPLGGGAPMELPRGALLGKSLPAAIKLYLAAVKRKQTVKEIAAALREGGVETTASNFEQPLTSALNRLKAAGELLRFKDGWALAEFYPENLRTRIAEKDSKPSKSGKNKKKASARRKAASAQAKAETATTASVSSTGPNLDTRIEKHLNANPMRVFLPAELRLAVGEPKGALIALALARLVRYGRIRRLDDSSYIAKAVSEESQRSAS